MKKLGKGAFVAIGLIICIALAVALAADATTGFYQATLTGQAVPLTKDTTTTIVLYAITVVVFLGLIGWCLYYADEKRRMQKQKRLVVQKRTQSPNSVSP